MEFTDEFLLALIEAQRMTPSVSFWDFGPMYCMGGEL